MTVKLDWDCYEASLLALVVYREARGETLQAQIAVAFSILNRVVHPGWWGSSLSAVIGKKWQYSSMTAPGDPQLGLFPHEPDPAFDQCMNAASMVLNAQVENPVPGADSYYDVSITAPKWATPSTFVKQIGNLIFHNVDHDYEA